MVSAQHTPAVVAAARELNRITAVACNVDVDDSWKTYGDQFTRDAEAALKAAGFDELLEALRQLAEVYDAMGAPRGPARIVADAAIAKATGSAP